MAPSAVLPSVPISHFDTAQVDRSDRFDAWQENIGVFFDLSAPDGQKQQDDICAQIDVCNLGETVFGVTRSQSQRFKRDARRVAHDDMDHILVQLFLKGGGVTAGNERITAGDMLIIDLAQPHDMVNADFENLTLVLPRELKPEISNLLTSLHGFQRSADNPMVRFMGDSLLNLWRHIPEMNVGQASGAMHGVLGLMHGWLAREGELPEENDPATSVALGKAIYRYIESHLAQPLTPADLAKTFRISRSQIYRIFAPHDGVANYVWDRRLYRSLKMLAQPQFNAISIGTIAFECGFTSEAHFSRAFKGKFGAKPSQIRGETLAAKLRQEDMPASSKGYAAGLPTWVRQL